MDGVTVSNHGGRQVDGAIAALNALPAVVEAVGDRLPVLFDSGIRWSADVLKAIALGARAVLLAGRIHGDWPSEVRPACVSCWRTCWPNSTWHLDCSVAGTGTRSTERSSIAWRAEGEDVRGRGASWCCAAL